MFAKKNLSIDNVSIKNDLAQDELRSKLPILIIEDGDFPVKDLLEKNGFKIDLVKDLESYNSLDSYHLILCDINDVGLKLGFKDGTELMKEIKRRKPMKVIIAYSTYDQPLAKSKILKIVNDFAEKDAGLEDWIEKLDQHLLDLMNPVTQWKLAREKLLNNGVSIHVVAELENDFVDKLKNKDLNRMKELKSYINLPEDIKPIIQSLLADGTFELIKIIFK